MDKKDYEAPCEFAVNAFDNDDMKKTLHHVNWEVNYNYPNSPLEVSVEFTTVSEYIDKSSTRETISSVIECDSVSIKKLKTGDMQLMLVAPYPQTALIYGTEHIIKHNNIFARFENLLKTKYTTSKNVETGFKNFKLTCDDEKKIFKISVVFTKKFEFSNF